MKLFAKMVAIVVLKRDQGTKRSSEPFTKQLTNVPRISKSSTYTVSHMYHFSSLFNKEKPKEWLFVVWMGLKTMRIVLNEMKPSFKP